MKVHPVHCVGLALVAVSVLVAAGCNDSGNTSGSGSDMDALAAQLEQAKKAEADAKAAQEAAAAKAAAEQQAAAEAAQRKTEEEAAAQAAAAAQPADGGRTTAGAGTVGQGGGYLSAIAAAHRHITTRVDDLAWTQALQHYKATTGEMPKNHEEFMRVMVEGDIPLPELEQGQDYFWDPSEGDWGTLYIVEPNPAGPKYALSVLGKLVDEVRPPMLPATDKAQAVIRAAMNGRIATTPRKSAPTIVIRVSTRWR